MKDSPDAAEILAVRTLGSATNVRPNEQHDTHGGAYRLLFSSREKFTMTLTLATPRHRADLTARTRAEFLDMPGLRLTLAQASRLCDASPEECQYVLDELIKEGLLCRAGNLYLRADLGRRSA